MQSQISHLGLVRRTLTLAAILGAGAAVLHAQTDNARPTTLNLATPAVQTTAAPEFSSSAATAETPESNLVASNTHFDFLGTMNAMQYGGTRSGRPRYRGGNNNPDGSNKYEFFVGGGMAIPVGTQSNYLKAGWGMQLGVQRNMNSNLGVALEFDYDHFGLANGVLGNYSSNVYGDTDQNTGIDGNSHIWSFTLDPSFKIHSGEKVGAYAVVGGGFYHKVTDFTAPATGCDPYYLSYYGICYPVASNAPLDHYTSNSAGLNGGLGLTYKFSRFSNERFYAEARLVHTFNTYRPGYDPLNPASQSPSYAGYNFFPENSQKTTYIPVKVGMRF